MLKKYIEIKVDGKVIAVCPVKECEVTHFIKIEREAEKNLAEVLGEIKALKKDIKFLKGEEDKEDD